jgi:hypothetical protein
MPVAAGDKRRGRRTKNMDKTGYECKPPESSVSDPHSLFVDPDPTFCECGSRSGYKDKCGSVYGTGEMLPNIF